MRQTVGSVSTKGQVTLPAEMREELGLRPGDKVRMVLQDHTIVVKREEYDTLESAYRSIPALKNKLSLKEMREIAEEDAAIEAAREGLYND
jgi:antitoxin PrlF